MTNNKKHILILCLGLLLFECLIIGTAAIGHPVSDQWLGNTILNPDDQAVYLGNIRQGSLLIQNLYAPPSNQGRFDAFWSPLSLIHGLTSISPILIHEFTKFLATILLAFVLYTAAISVTKNSKDALLLSILASTGIGLGWLVVILNSLGIYRSTTDLIAPDLASEFAIAPSLLGGAHIIVSIALLLFIMQRIWNRKQKSLPIFVAILYLTSFHPYLIPLIGMGLIAESIMHARREQKAICLNRLLILGSAMIPSLLYYVMLLQDTSFKTHHFGTNLLPLSDFIAWIFVLSPAMIALYWMHQKDLLKKRVNDCEWCVAWILIGILLALFFPVPWSRKFLEGLMIPLVFITFPAWRALYEWFCHQGLRVLFYCLLFLSPFSLIMAQLYWSGSGEGTRFFSQSQSVFDAWKIVGQHSDAILLSDSDVINLWTPVWSEAKSYYGHPHETPDYESKRNAARQALTENPSLLEDLPITHLLLVKPETIKHAGTFEGWKRLEETSDLLLLEKVR